MHGRRHHVELPALLDLAETQHAVAAVDCIRVQVPQHVGDVDVEGAGRDRRSPLQGQARLHVRHAAAEAWREGGVYVDVAAVGQGLAAAEEGEGCPALHQDQALGRPRGRYVEEVRAAEAVIGARVVVEVGGVEP